MSALPPPRGAFGGGGAEPWAEVLRAGGGDLWLQREDGGRSALDTARWAASADATDRRALVGLTGPVLDVGCGPGRMVRAALDAGLPALGVDVSPAAIRACRSAALPVLRCDVFGPVPRAGRWGAVLLIDGNVGIGGDVGALLTRCRTLLAPDGAVVAEVHRDSERDERSTQRVIDADGRSSAPFPWAQVGEQALAAAAPGFAVDAAWTADGRRFVRLVRDRTAARE